jgi:HAD superfamily hydrolase (TIGR01662 family)
MPSENISTVFFDLGYTLINFVGDVPYVLRTSYRALANSLLQSGCQIELEAFTRQYEQIINRYYITREIDMIEKPVEVSVNQALAAFDQPPVPPTVLKEAIAAMFRVTEARWRVELDTHKALGAIHAKGYQMGLISNASNVDDLNILIDKTNLREYFSCIVISAEEGVRKPDGRIYEKAMRLMDTEPATCLMVGDTLIADVFGSQQAGMRAVWVTRRASRPENLQAKGKVIPNWQINRLSDLPPLLDSIK